MDDDTSCGVKRMLRRLFRKMANRSEVRSEVSMTESHGSISTISTDIEAPIKIIRVKGRRIPRRNMPIHLRHLARENSLAPYLGRNGEPLVAHRVKVTVLPDGQLRGHLGRNQRVCCSDAEDFDAFTEASTSCPIAEESFDSGLLRMTSPWFLD